MEFVKSVRNGLRTEISGSGYLESARNFDPNPMAMVPEPQIWILGFKTKQNLDCKLILSFHYFHLNEDCSILMPNHNQPRSPVGWTWMRGGFGVVLS